jgi:hypothetical protein
MSRTLRKGIGGMDIETRILNLASALLASSPSLDARKAIRIAIRIIAIFDTLAEYEDEATEHEAD